MSLGPGKAFRKGITLIDAINYFSDEPTAEAWFIEQRWPDGIRCPRCDSDSVHQRKSRKPMPFLCRDCRRDFSVKTDTVMQGSNLPLSKWAIAFYQISTNLKGVSSMKLHRDLGITQKAAWHMLHRIREAWDNGKDKFGGPVEVDEHYVGGKSTNMHATKKRRMEKVGTAYSKFPVVGMKDRATNQVKAEVVETTDKPTLQGFVHRNTEADALIYTDEAKAYIGMRRRHETVRHSVGEYVRDMAHTNGLESFWAMLRRGHIGTYHKLSLKHLHRYVREFSGRHNDRPLDTAAQLSKLACGVVGRRLRYSDLIGPRPDPSTMQLEMRL